MHGHSRSWYETIYSTSFGLAEGGTDALDDFPLGFLSWKRWVEALPTVAGWSMGLVALHLGRLVALGFLVP